MYILLIKLINVMNSIPINWIELIRPGETSNNLKKFNFALIPIKTPSIKIIPSLIHSRERFINRNICEKMQKSLKFHTSLCILMIDFCQ